MVLWLPTIQMMECVVDVLFRAASLHLLFKLIHAPSRRMQHRCKHVFSCKRHKGRSTTIATYQNLPDCLSVIVDYSPQWQRPVSCGGSSCASSRLGWMQTISKLDWTLSEHTLNSPTGEVFIRVHCVFGQSSPVSTSVCTNLDKSWRNSMLSNQMRRYLPFANSMPTF